MSLLRFSRSLFNIKVKILSKPDCCLCDQAAFNISRLLTSMGPDTSRRVLIEHVNIETDEELMSEYALTVPVILVDEEIVCESRIDIPSIRRSITSKLDDIAR